VAQDVSPFDARPPRRRRRRQRIGGVVALLAVLGLAVATWALGNSDGVVPPTNPETSRTTPTAPAEPTEPATGRDGDR
jgi:ferric-dicitrate binding protein FerR (iron transport regulator)